MLCLGVGIGVNGAAFSVLDAFLFRDFPGIRRQGELTTLLVSRQYEWGMSSSSTISEPERRIFKGAIPGFSSSGVMGFASLPIPVSGQPVAARSDFVSGDFFAMLETTPAAGRLLTAADDDPAAPPAIVLGHQYWVRQYEGRGDAIGSTLRIGDASFTIVGVAPKGFTGLYPGELVADPEFGALPAALGLAAVLAFVVEQRRDEIGARMALGARASTVTRDVMRQSLLLPAVGAATGAAGAAATAVSLRSMLFGLPPNDLTAFAASTGVVLAVALLASAIPARRAARTDPMIALRPS